MSGSAKAGTIAERHACELRVLPEFAGARSSEARFRRIFFSLTKTYMDVSLSCARSCNQEHTLHFSEMGYDVGPQPAHVTRRHSGPWRKAVDALDEVGRGGSSNSRLPWGSPCLGARGGLV